MRAKIKLSVRAGLVVAAMLLALPQGALALTPPLPGPSLPVPLGTPVPTQAPLPPLPALPPAPAAPAGQPPPGSVEPASSGGPVTFAAPAVLAPAPAPYQETAQERRHDAYVPSTQDREEEHSWYYQQQQSEVAGQVDDMSAYDGQALQAGGGKGEFVAPMAPHVGRLTQRFGCSDLLGEPFNPACASKHWHTGADLAGPAGTPIFAADTGVVRTFPGTKGYGNYALIRHGNGWSTLYGHLKAFAVPDGTLVHKGDVIGFEGSTGYSTGPHLHFEVRYQDRYVDPCAAAINC